MKAVIVNYGMGNLKSLQNALSCLNLNSVISSDPDEISNSDMLFLPGVGSFRQAMQNIRNSGIEEALNHAVIKRGVPFIGICLGMQLIASVGYEDGTSNGLGWIEGSIIKLEPRELRLPHVGFNEVVQQRQNESLFAGIDDKSDFYFIHSFHFDCKDEENIIGITTYGDSFVSAVQRDNIVGVQFHPEKSQHNGLQLLTNFISTK